MKSIFGAFFLAVFAAQLAGAFDKRGRDVLELGNGWGAGVMPGVRWQDRKFRSDGPFVEPERLTLQVGRDLGAGERIHLTFAFRKNDALWSSQPSREVTAATRSHVLMATRTRRRAVTPTISAYGGIAAGVSLNETRNVRENNVDGAIIAQIRGRKGFSPAIGSMFGADWELGRGAFARIDADLAYIGDFRTGTQRQPTTGSAHAIAAYRKNNVFRGSLMASFVLRF